MARNRAKDFTGDLSPVTIYKYAESFLEAASREFEVENISIPGYFLAGRAAELAIKAYMLATGASERDLRDVGHDLSAALKQVEALELGETGRTVLLWLNPYYSGKDLEYPKTGFKHLPDRIQTIEEVRGLLELVKPDVWRVR